MPTPDLKAYLLDNRMVAFLNMYDGSEESHLFVMVLYDGGGLLPLYEPFLNIFFVDTDNKYLLATPEKAIEISDHYFATTNHDDFLPLWEKFLNSGQEKMEVLNVVL